MKLRVSLMDHSIYNALLEYLSLEKVHSTPMLECRMLRFSSIQETNSSLRLYQIFPEVRWRFTGEILEDMQIE